MTVSAERTPQNCLANYVNDTAYTQAARGNRMYDITKTLDALEIIFREVIMGCVNAADYAEFEIDLDHKELAAIWAECVRGAFPSESEIEDLMDVREA